MEKMTVGMMMAPIEEPDHRKNPMVEGRTFVFVDEEGDLGREARKNGKKWDPSKTFGFGLSVVNEKDIEVFGNISSLYKERKGITGEFKARKAESSAKIMMGLKIRIIGAKTYGVYVDKIKDRPKGWNDERTDGSDLQIEMLYQAINSVMTETRSDKVTVIIDYHTAYGQKKGDNKVTAMSEPISEKNGKEVVCEIATRRYRSQMETNDVVVHAIHDRKQDHSPWASLVMGQRIIRLDKNNDLRKNQR